jgi:hypothetical protein
MPRRNDPSALGLRGCGTDVVRWHHGPGCRSGVTKVPRYLFWVNEEASPVLAPKAAVAGGKVPNFRVSDAVRLSTSTDSDWCLAIVTLGLSL